MANYLTAEATASVPGIRLICRQIAVEGATRTSELASALRPSEYLPDSGGEGSILGPSLAVAQDLKLLASDGEKDPAWELGPLLSEMMHPEGLTQDAGAFRPLVLKGVGGAALSSIANGSQPSDVARGLTWLMSRDPLDNLTWEYPDAEVAMKRVGMTSAVAQKTQWNPFRRWALSLGLAVRSPNATAKPCLAIRTSQAILDLGKRGTTATPAKQFVEELLQEVPLLGLPMLLEQLPNEARPNWDGSVSPALAQGLLTLEARGLARFEPGDDSDNVIQLSVGTRPVRAIRSVHLVDAGSTK